MRYPRVLKALGVLLLLSSLSLLIPLFGSLYWDDGTPMSSVPNPVTGGRVRETTLVFLITFLTTVFFGLFLTLVPREDLDELRERESYAIVGFAYLLLPLFGSLPFLLSGATRSPVVAFFESMSGITTTGATALRFPLEQYPPSIHLWRSTLQYVGGMGIVVLSVAILQRMTEGAYRLIPLEAPGGTVTRLKPKITQTAKALWTVYTILVAAMFATMWLLIHYSGRALSWKVSAFEALCTAMSALSTGGFHPRTDSIAFYGSSAITWTVLIFMIIGGLNFNLLWIASHGNFRRLLKDSQTRFYMLILVLASALIAASLFSSGRPLAQSAEEAAFQSAAFITTTGFTSANHDAFPDVAKLALLLLMFTGACTGSTSGGLKVLRVQLLAKLTFREVLKLLHPHAVSVVKLGGRILPDETMRRIIVFFFSYLMIFLVGSFGFLLTGFPLVDATAASISSLSNVGPAFGTAAFGYAEISPLSQLIAAILMWLGRLEVFTALLLFVPGTYRD